CASCEYLVAYLFDGYFFFFSSRRRHTRFSRDWSSDVCSSDLWSIQLAPGFANPITYMLDGRQYVTVATGRSGFQAPGRLYTFALDASAPVPSMDPVGPPPDPSGISTAERVREEFDRVGLPDEPGRALVQQLCSGCHAPTVVTRFRLPEQGWRETVQDMVSRGMGGTPEERAEVLRYLTK